MKNKLLILLAAVFVFVLCACGQTGDATGSAANETPGEYTVGSPQLYKVNIPEDYKPSITQEKCITFMNIKDNLIVNTDFTVSETPITDEATLSEILASYGDTYDLTATGNTEETDQFTITTATGTWTAENGSPVLANVYLLQNTQSNAVSTIIFIYEDEADEEMEKSVVSSFSIAE